MRMYMRNKNTHPHKNLYTYIHRSIIHNNHKKNGNNPNIHQMMNTRVLSGNKNARKDKYTSF